MRLKTALLSGFLTALVFSGGCGSPVNRLGYAIKKESAKIIQAKQDLIALDGILLFTVAPDSASLSIDYDRLKCSQSLIEEKLQKAGLQYRLQIKERLKNGGDEAL